ncbi:MAG TPA: nitrate/nitrite transporter [Rhodopila sp.]|uniref:nitrate/nitrite transporter n=1 Tax=Rhodopila sp. TaxID=2480087 RepID=UPI002C26404C|nr:nitrate/nitrite transporter [Rhodopila sp.]HVY17652.1 nitrate/nitrite transporter [Rhodopila sp.]
MHKGFLKSGHLPTLFASFLYFDLSFMVWVLLGPLGVAIAKQLHLDPAHKGLMVATPVLVGAALRVVLGLLVDRFKAKRVGIGAQVVVIAGLVGAWAIGIDSFSGTLALGCVLGLAGASFAVALPLASAWYPPEHQGTALGIAGAGNSGTVLAALFAPGLALAVGWQNVVGLAAVPLAVAFVVFILLAEDSPNSPPPKPLSAYFNLLKIGDCWWFMFFYSVTFGGFVGLASSLTIYFNDAYGLSAVTAGYCTAAVVFVGSMVRPIGGAIADRIGGVQALQILYAVAAAAFATVAAGLSTIYLALPVFILGMLALGMGNGSVFQLVPQRFKREIGVMTGLVGMSGGVGGFYLASSLGYSKQMSGSYGPGFLVFALLAIVALVSISSVRRRWRTTWAELHGAARV